MADFNDNPEVTVTGLTDTWRAEGGRIKHRSKVGREVHWDEAEAREVYSQLGFLLRDTPARAPVAVQVAVAQASEEHPLTIVAIGDDGAMYLIRDHYESRWQPLDPLPTKANCNVSPTVEPV